ncbi:MAG: hypothetical protein JWS10_4157 [Cypionkella sp.]|uniref:sugar phosphate isomerase/epimerase family protein n=1 Tax=Cypionkella sp. TaxID=2811411 RepID=UPI00260F26B1|nr:sugar phosphate isomerase/epimerase family protein [Cypionkella sp.]MDB5661542.1 hypothetical protein [Cypionkella sp.]
MLGNRFATRINSFASGASDYWPGLTAKPSLAQIIQRAATVEGLTELDLNYPDHVGANPSQIAEVVADCGLSISGLAMRYYTNPAFKRGAFTNPDRTVRREAIDLTKRGIDAARAIGAPMMTLWLGQDGFDYTFQCDYAALWEDAVAGIAEVAAHDADCLISIEYKPNEPRAYSVLPDAATTLLAIREVGAKNLGVTIDFAHALYADEQPAFAAALIQRHSRILGLHLNDGYAKRDDGLMVAAVHEQATLELLREVKRGGFEGAIYFDTFPDASGLDPVAECAANIRTVRRMLAAVDVMAGDNRLADAQSRQDPIAAQEIARVALAGCTASNRASQHSI